MQLVDPTNAYTLETTDFGTVISPNPLSISDIAYNATAGLLVGIIDPGVITSYIIHYTKLYEMELHYLQEYQNHLFLHLNLLLKDKLENSY